MMVTKDKILQAFDRFLEDDVMRHMREMPQVEQFLFGIKIGVVRRRASSIVDNYLDKPEIKQLGVVKDGKVDIDVIYEAAVDSIKQLGSVQIDTLRFDESDVKKLYEIIQQIGG